MSLIASTFLLFTGIMVFSTALSPFLMGWMLDDNIAIESILLMQHPRFWQE